MKLVIATPLYPPENGGPATYAKLLEEGLPGNGVHVVSVVKYRDVARHPKGISHIVYAYNVWKSAKDADAILALDPVSVGLPVMLAALFCGKPYFVKVVGDYAWEQGVQRFGVSSSLDEFQEESTVNPVVIFFRLLQTLVTRFAKSVIVPSNYLQKIVSGWGVQDKKITVIYNALQPESIGSVPENVKALAQPLVVTAARLVPWKNIPGVVDAVESLQKNGVAASLAIVGDGPDRTALEKYAMRTKNTIFTGALPHNDALAVIDRADVFVLNSSYEGLSHLLIEAVSLGVPVVATAVGGNAEVITHNVNGLLVPPGNTEELTKAIRHLFDKAEAERLTRGAPEFATRFSAQTMLEKTAAFLLSFA